MCQMWIIKNNSHDKIISMHNLNCTGNWFRRLSTNWNCPDHWKRTLPLNWNCLNNLLWALSINRACLDSRASRGSINLSCLDNRAWCVSNKWNKRFEWASPSQWRIVHTLDLAVRPKNELRNICGAGIERSVGTAIMPYAKLRGYPCENLTQNPRKDAILALVLPQYNEYAWNNTFRFVSGYINIRKGMRYKKHSQTRNTGGLETSILYRI